MLFHQKGEVCILRLLCRIFIAVPVYSHNPVGILIYNNTVRIHTKRPYLVLKLFRAVHDLALIELIGQM